ncbi:hypothetical protein [Enterobacter ludwigii]|uniref:hypothetical protein n=1 Tax=Enterobacter ludwigii TaxID=299767 RepID=UPI00064A5689|nr:hypothetical protein [Enterobacter ludwigii]KYO05104.1 hypothetical protein ABR30_0216550 [Enterobacter ludwigii]
MEWLTANASAIIAAASALLAAIIAGCTTVSSILFTNKSNKALRQEQFDFDKWKANRDFFLAKGEELFTFFNKWHELVHQLHTTQTFQLLGLKSSQDMQNELKDFPLKEIAPKIGAINSMFFPDLVEEFNTLQSLSGHMTVVYAQSLSGDITSSNGVITINEKMETLRVKAEAYRSKLAEKVRQHL